MATVSSLKKRVASLKRWLNVLEDGLNGQPHSLGDGEGDYFQKYVQTLGLELISQSAAAKRGLVLKRGAGPICSRYYTRPISDYGNLYLLEQFNARAEAQAKAETPAA